MHLGYAGDGGLAAVFCVFSGPVLPLGHQDAAGRGAQVVQEGTVDTAFLVWCCAGLK